MMERSRMIAENKRRLSELFEPYDPIIGIGSPIERHKLEYYDEFTEKNVSIFLPVEMFQEHLIAYLFELKSIKAVLETFFGNSSNDLYEPLVKEFTNIRYKYDFEFWAATAAHIQDKETKTVKKFVLNRGQRKIWKSFHKSISEGKPIRKNLLKARQYGGSTVIQLIFAWIQTQIKENWHSAICADVDDQARNIRSMYSRFADYYPSDLGTITLKPFEQSGKNKIIAERGNIIGVGSAQTPDNLRSYDFSMLHLSEVGSFKKTKQKGPLDLVQTLRAGILNKPYTAIILESTAKGVGNFWHTEYMAAKEGRSGYDAIFVAFWEIENYTKKVEDYDAFIKTWTDRQWYLWSVGASIEAIKWHTDFQRDEHYSDWRMDAEFPPTEVDAFKSTGRRVFAPSYVLQLRKRCSPPEFIGDLYSDELSGPGALKNIRFEKSPGGSLWIWALPDTEISVSNRYCVSVDIGGRTEGADFSTIRVIDRYLMSEAGEPEAVATWRGHIDQDIFAWIAARIAKFYNNALLVVESNSLRTDTGGSEGDHVLTILDEIANHYNNIYYRTDPEKIKQGMPVKYGFHTNSKTKILIIDKFNGAARDRGYTERDVRVCDEMDTYEIKEDGTYGAVDGGHDDLVMSTAIGYWVSTSVMDLPKLSTPAKPKPRNFKRTEAMI